MKKILICIGFAGNVLYGAVGPHIPFGGVVLAAIADHCAMNPDNPATHLCFASQVKREIYERTILNERMPISELNPLDRAAEEEDETMIFNLLDEDVQPVKDYRTIARVADIMMSSSDRRSLQVLKQLADDGYKFPPFESKWATNLEPQLVFDKLEIVWKSFCPKPENLPESTDQDSDITPGTRALRHFILKCYADHARSTWEWPGCSIV